MFCVFVSEHMFCVFISEHMFCVFVSEHMFCVFISEHMFCVFISEHMFCVFISEHFFLCAFFRSTRISFLCFQSQQFRGAILLNAFHKEVPSSCLLLYLGCAFRFSLSCGVFAQRFKVVLC
jgi:hypothetical protein